MSADASIELPFGDGKTRFRLGIGEWAELQDKCDAGLVAIMDRLEARKWRVEDVRETIRLGLIGGGLAPIRALAKIARYVDGQPLADNVPIAYAILAAAIIGVPEDPVGKNRPEGSDGTGASSSPASMAPAAP